MFTKKIVRDIIDFIIKLIKKGPFMSISIPSGSPPFTPSTLNVNHQDAHGRTPLHLVCAEGWKVDIAQFLIKNGANIMAVRKMLGNENESTTQGYIRTLGITIKAVHKKTHPREKDKEEAGASKPKIERRVAQHGSK